MKCCFVRSAVGGNWQKESQKLRKFSYAITSWRIHLCLQNYKFVNGFWELRINALNSIRTLKVTYQVRNTFNRLASPCQMSLRLPEICFQYYVRSRRKLSATVFVTWESRVGNHIILTGISGATGKKKISSDICKLGLKLLREKIVLCSLKCDVLS